MIKKILNIYFLKALIAACIYCITVVIFLIRGEYRSVWLLFMGNALYMLAIGAIVYFTNRAKNFNQQPVKSSISGHILSFTGAALSVILTLLLYLVFYISGITYTLQKAPVSLSANTTHGMLLILIVTAALGNTITGFFAALLTSFDVSQKKQHA